MAKTETVTAEQYTDLCDVVERARHHWPTEHDEDNPLTHTSDYARHAAIRILEILGLADDFRQEAAAELARMDPKAHARLRAYYAAGEPMRENEERPKN